MSTKADNALNQQKTSELKDVVRESWRRKRIRKQGSQTDDEAVSDEEHDHGSESTSAWKKGTFKRQSPEMRRQSCKNWITMPLQPRLCWQLQPKSLEELERDQARML